MDTSPISEKPKRDWLLPSSILVSALIVALALVYNAGKRAGDGTAQSLAANISATAAAALLSVEAPSAGDHVRGDPNAPVVVVEFSDLECPFCKMFHDTMNQMLAMYQTKVAFVYRHFPLDELHPKARNEAAAAECAGTLGGDQAFWAFVDRLFSITPSNNGLDPSELPRIATYVGLKQADFESCLASGHETAKVAADVAEGDAAGVQGTPFSILVLRKPLSASTKSFIQAMSDSIAQQLPPGSPPTLVVTDDGTRVSMNGALPSDLVEQVLDRITAEI